jgi:hypothetical protein
MAGSASRKQRAGVRLDRSSHPDFFNVRPAAPDRSGLMPANEITLAHVPVSAVMNMMTVIASVAKQSSAQCKPPLDCFVANAPRNDNPHSSLPRR